MRVTFSKQLTSNVAHETYTAERAEVLEESYHYPNQKTDRDKLKRISGYSRECVNTPALLAAIPLHFSLSAPADEPPPVFSQCTSAKSQPGQILEGMKQAQDSAGAWSHRNMRSRCKRPWCTAFSSCSSSDLSRARSQASFDQHSSFEELIPAALLLGCFNLGKNKQHLAHLPREAGW